MVFGVHLLAKRLAKSEVQVMKILQTHVDEVDGFLQRTTEDLRIIHLDVRTRIQYLNLPLGNLDVFDVMLEDRNFRLSLVAYNDQIEHAVTRFTLAITDALKDMQKGKEAMGALWHYLHQLADEGCFESDSLKAFQTAMVENIDGWIIALSKLRRRGTGLQKALGQLAFAVTEMERRVGVASRKDLVSAISLSLAQLQHCVKSNHMQRSFLKANNGLTRAQSVKQRLFASGPTRVSDKPLPRDPFLKPRGNQRASRKTDDIPTRSKTADDPNGPKVAKRDSAVPTPMNRAKSCNDLIGAASAGATAPHPRIPGRLSRKLSKPFLPKQNISETSRAAHNRPATAPARTLKSRSVSMEQLKALWANGRPRTQQSMAKSPTQPRTSQQPADGSESMKDQISQFLKTDRVVEAWDSMASKTTSCCGPLAKPSKDWPCSIFRAKSQSPNPWRNRPAHNQDLSGADLERQMSWVQDAPEVLTTYSFRQRPEATPRIHVLSVQFTPNGDVGPGPINHQANGVLSSDAGSVITALPAVPPPTPTFIPPVSPPSAVHSTI